jgi:ATP-dependent Clp protease ATP-binding subunit ClpA
VFGAQIEATNLGGNTLQPAHLLISLIRREDEVIDDIFKQIAPDRTQLLSDLLTQQPLDGVRTSLHLDFSEDSMSVLLCSVEEAKDLRSFEVEPEHILLGILQTMAGDLGELLMSHNITLSRVRDEVKKLQQEG